MDATRLGSERTGCVKMSKNKKIPYNPKLKQLAQNLRKKSTLGEVLLWQRLKGKAIKGRDFHRQKPIGNYIVDFFCSDLMLAIEIDGVSHEFKPEQDEKRQKDLCPSSLDWPVFLRPFNHPAFFSSLVYRKPAPILFLLLLTQYFFMHTLQQLLFAQHFPFTKSARKIVLEENPSLEALPEPVIERAELMARHAFAGKMLASGFKFALALAMIVMLLQRTWPG